MTIATKAPTKAPTKARRAALAAAVTEAGLDALLVTRLVNAHYLSGFTGSAAAVLVMADGTSVFATDGRYAEQAANELADEAGGAAGAPAVVITRHAVRELVDEAVRRGSGAIGVEGHEMTVEQYGELGTVAAGARLVPAGRLVEGLRATKDATEVHLLRAAFGIADRALTELLDSGGVREGRTEADVARDLDHRMRCLGADDRAFETIVAAGTNGALPHHRPTDRPLGAGDLVTIDFGARLAGYHSDCTRTVVVGAPAQWQRDLHALVRAAQDAAVAAAVAGAQVAAVDEAARDVLRQAGLADRFVHPVGHGLGLEIHERPILTNDAAGTLGHRYAVTVEPGVYLPGRCGIRVEDALVVGGPDQGPEILTRTPRELLAV